MKLGDYLNARNESENAFAQRAGIPQRTLNRVCQGGGTTVDTASRIVNASREEPAPDGGTVRFEDLVTDTPAQGAA